MSNNVNALDLKAAQDQFRQQLPSDLRLLGKHVSLEPMAANHVEELNVAALDGELWKLKTTEVPTRDAMERFVSHAIAQRQRGAELPFVVRRIEDQRVVGTTRYYNISSINRNLSIGYTWYSQSAQRTSINTECKLVLLQHVFETAGCISVQWHTHHENIQSQKAITRLGAKFEGVLRNHRILPDGRIRHTHCFSMLNTEWAESKAFLKGRLANFQRD